MPEAAVQVAVSAATLREEIKKRNLRARRILVGVLESSMTVWPRG
jgi:hypothetical protein